MIYPENNKTADNNFDADSSEQALHSKKSQAIALYENSLETGCEQLLALNRTLLKSERSQRVKQTLYRLGWVSSLSTVVVIVSYLTVGVNLITAVGLLMSYFAGLVLHDRFSPQTILPEKEAEKLYTLNNKLRETIAEAEDKEHGLLFPLLKDSDLLNNARKNGLKLTEEKIDCYQLDGNGLYQYLDAINLLMKHRCQWDNDILTGSTPAHS